MIRRSLPAALLAALLALPAAAAGQSGSTTQRDALVLVVEPGPVWLDVDALRGALAEATGRRVLGLGDEAAREVGSTLTIARPAPQRWVLRHARGEAEAWEEITVTEGPVRRALLAASVALLARPLERAAAQPSPAETPAARSTAETPAEPVVQAEHTWVETVPDVVDPFERSWSPLRVALDGELMSPFARLVTSYRHASWHDLADPFADAVGHGVFDPWAPSR